MVAVGRLALVERFCRLAGWQPLGKRVRLLVAESQDSTLFDAVLSGTIIEILDDVTTVGAAGRTTGGCAAVVKLDAELRWEGRLLGQLVVLPVWYGHGFYRLCVGEIGVNLHTPDTSSPPTEVHEETYIGRWLMKVDRQRHRGPRPSQTAGGRRA